MRIHEIGNKNAPKLMLLPGTFCDCYGNFDSVIPLLEKDFYILLVSYSGFEEQDKEPFTTILHEVEKIENYVLKEHGGLIDGIYGSSLGGSLVSHLVSRGRVKCKHAILGSSDLDQDSKIMADIKTRILVGILYPILISGKIKGRTAKFFLRKKSKPVLDKLLHVLGGKREWLKKESCVNQYKSDLMTKLPLKISQKNTKIHIFYAMKMGTKYLNRYQTYFLNPIIYRQDYAHEELLVFYPEKWTETIKEILLSQKV